MTTAQEIIMNIETIINTLNQESEDIKKQQEKLETAISTIISVLPELKNYEGDLNEELEKHPATCELLKMSDRYSYEIRKIKNAIKELQEIKDFQ